MRMLCSPCSEKPLISALLHAMTLSPLSLFIIFFLFMSFPLYSSSPDFRSDPFYSQSPTPPPSHKLRRAILSVISGSLAGISFSLLLILSIRFCLVYANKTPILRGPVIFLPSISPKSLQFALSNPARLIPIPGLGLYTRVIFDDGLAVAVKKLEPVPCQSSSAKRKLQRELGRLAMVSHKNVMALRAYVRDPGERFSLVYDNVGGSLEDAMKRAREGKVELGWELRHRICLGVAKGLRHLHFECRPRILHYDLKPMNVLLDEEFEPKLADCGLSRIMGSGGALVSCYTAPECAQSCRYTDKSDVFSFGVILAALLTGRDPQGSFSGDGGIGKWLRHLQQTGEVKEALDRSILGQEGDEEEEMLMALRISIVCLSDLPADRPSSDELVAMLSQLHSF